MAVIAWLWPSICQRIGKPDWGTDVPQGIIFGLAFLALSSAFFKAWRVEHGNANTANTRLKELTVPQLLPHIEQLVWTDEVVGLTEKGVWFICMVSVANTGAPSICEGYSLGIVMPDGNKFDTKRMMLQTNPNLNFSGGRAFTLSKMDFLAAKTASTPIGTGAKVHGYLIFMLSGVAKSLVSVPGTKITLTCQDIRGKLLETSMALTGKNDDPSVIPGMSTLVTR